MSFQVSWVRCVNGRRTTLPYSRLMILKPDSLCFDISSSSEVQHSVRRTLTVENYSKIKVITLQNILTRDFRYLFFYQYFLHGSFCFTCSTNTDGTLYVSEEDKNEKEATADSVQQRRQYRRQNRQSSSGYKTFFCFFCCIFSPVLSSAISNPTPPPSIKPLSVSLTLFVSWTLLKLCPLPSPCCLSSLEPVGRTWFLTDGCLMVVFFFFRHRLRVFLLGGRGTQQATVWTRCPERRRQEETKSYAFTTEAAQRPFSKVSL